MWTKLRLFNNNIEENCAMSSKKQNKHPMWVCYTSIKPMKSNKIAK